MNKKGQLESLIGVALIIGLVTIGTISSLDIYSKTRFVGDVDSKTYYDLSKCVIDMSSINITGFENEEQAIKLNFTKAACNG